MSPGERCDQIIRLIDETLRAQPKQQAVPTAPARPLGRDLRTRSSRVTARRWQTMMDESSGSEA